MSAFADDTLLVPPLTAALPGTGGRLKESPEDFVVEELPAYDPCGAGEHLWLWVEKRDVAADQLLGHLARTLDLPRRDLGCAGMKDRRAVTRQWVSVPARAQPRLAGIETDQIHLLGATAHREKLRTGQLTGNRFDVLLREVDADAEARARLIVDELNRRGLPNAYGRQRFGHDGQNVPAGLALMRGEPTAGLRQVGPDRRGFLRRLFLSAAQSWLFNRALHQRIVDGLFEQIIDGDLVQHPRLGGPYLVRDLVQANQALTAHTLVHTGPMFGPKMPDPRGLAREREITALAVAGLDRQQLGPLSKLAAGTRRANLVWPGAVEFERVSEGLRLRFTLPRGCYATVLLAEIMKTGADVPGDACEPENPCDQ